MPSSTVTLTKGALSKTINGPIGDQPVDAVPQYVTDMAHGGTRYSYRMSAATNRLWTLTFPFLTDTNKSDLEEFYHHSTVLGPSNTFTYAHTDGSSYTARFISTVLAFTRAGSNLWSVTIQLEILGAIS
jgi:hypothetical protein